MKKETAIEWIKTIVYPLILAIIIIQFIKPTIVREFSMLPNFYENDYVIVNKVAYFFGDPEYMDVVVFESNLLDERGENKFLIKRVIGVPGDTIKVEGGQVYKNGEILVEDYVVPDSAASYAEEVTVPDGMLYVMGDNRPNSRDSRDPDIGLIDQETVLGDVFVRLYPFNRIGLI